ncbi:gliding motility-associated C-terminal domain-containing protein [Tenacibaculum dicentrarchi]|nr:gliding motility-associated C-terminal domain-containing protein [Tenacibaculum dicentrarchi]
MKKSYLKLLANTFCLAFLLFPIIVNSQVVSTWGNLSGSIPENNFSTSSYSSIADGTSLVKVDVTRTNSSTVGGPINAVPPSLTLTNSFNNARATVGISGNTYTYIFSEPVFIKISSEEHSEFFRNENIKISSTTAGAQFSGSFVNGQVGHSIENNNTSSVHFISDGSATAAGTHWLVESNIALTSISVEYYVTNETEAVSSEPFTLNLAPTPFIRLDSANITGAGGIDLNSSACSTGSEILDNTNTGATSILNAPFGIESMTVTLTNSQNIGDEELTMKGAFLGLIVSGNNTTSLTFKNDGTAPNSSFRNSLDDIFYKNNAAVPNTTVNRILEVQLTDINGVVSNIAKTTFPVFVGPVPGETNGPIFVLEGSGNIDLFTALDGSQDAGGTWVDVDSTGALSGSTVDESLLPLGGTIFRYEVSGISPCNKATVTVVIIKISNNEIGLTSSTSCGELLTEYTNPLYSSNSDDPIFLFTSGSGELTSPLGASGTIYDWYKFNPASNSYDTYALNSTATQTGLTDGGYLVVRNDGGTVVEGRAWVWNTSLSLNIGADETVCAGDTLNLNGVGSVTNPKYTYYDPRPRPLILTPTTKITVTFDATHTYISDLAFYLIPPGGDPRPIIDGGNAIILAPKGKSCNSGENVSGLTFTNDPGAGTFTMCSSPKPTTLSGVFNSYYENRDSSNAPTFIDWSTLNSEDARKGGWAVQIYDCVRQDVGRLKGAVIKFDDGLGNVVTHSSGSIDVEINDFSCDASSASIYVVPFVPPVLNINSVVSLVDGIGLNGALGGYQWSYSTVGDTGPWAPFENETLSPSRIFNEDTWIKLEADNGVRCVTEVVKKISVVAKPKAGVGSDSYVCVGDASVNLSSLLTGQDAAGVWSVSAGSPNNPVADFNASTATYNPTARGVYQFDYTVTATTPCVNDTSTVTVFVSGNSVTAASNTPTLCINELLTDITHQTTGATGIGVAQNLPTGITAVFTSDNIITLSGTPTVSGVFNYTIPLTGGCGTLVNATGKITVTADMTVTTVPQTVTTINTALTNITHTTTLAIGISNDGISGANGLPQGVNASFLSDKITISGTPTVSGTFNYEIDLTGSCKPLKATGTIIVKNALLADDDTLGTASTPLSSGTTDVSAGEVLTGDTLNGVQVTTATTDVTPITTGNILIDADGNVTIAANTPTGSYDVEYEICESGANPDNCTKATVTVFVVGELVANIDDFTGTALTIGDDSPSVIADDTLDGVAVVIGTNPGQVTLNGTTVPSEVTLNADGTITVNAGSPSGTYEVTYEICENGANPANCKSNTATVLVENPLVANIDDFTGTALTIGDDSPSVIADDTLDGVAVVIGTNPGQVTLNGTTVPSEVTLNADGTITVNAGSPSGTYEVTYEICENGANPANCKSNTATVLVENPLVANIDDFTGTALTIGDDSPSVIADDTLDGVAVVIGTNPGQVTLNGTTVPSEVTLNADGTITVNAGSPSGTYEVTYEICENGANPANCKSNTATVLVENPLVANIDDFTGTALTIGDDSPSVIADDTLDGVAVVIGTNPGQVTLNGTTVPSEVTLNADGTITVNAGSPSGTYEVTYEICENGANPANCKSNTATVLVENPLVANIDDFTGTALTIGDDSPSVIADDTLDGVAVVIGTNPGQVTLNGTTVPSEVTLNADGTITVNAGSPSGTYEVTYEICENGANPANCKSNTATVLVENPLVANIDDFTGTALTIGDDSPSVIADDTLDGVAVVIGTNPGQVTLNGTTVPSEVTLNADGTITVNAGSPSGTYEVTYEICENGANPANCKSNTATVLVENPLVANIDDFTGTALTIGDDSPSVIADDTLDGVAVVIGTNPGQVTLNGTTVPSEVTLNADGTITVNAGSPSGTYEVTYEICENGANPANCKSNTATVLVENPLVANIDDFTGTALTIGDDSPSVIADDTLDGVAVVIGTNPGQVTLNGTTVPSEVTLNADGTITVNAGSPSGTYEVTYEICENGANPANCKSNTATVLVENPLVANIDDFTGTALTIGDDSPSVIADDTLDGVAVVIGTNPGQVTLNGTTVPSEVTLNADGTITVNAGSPSGTYEVTYEICENGANPANCKSNTATVLVENPLVANIDDFTGTALTIGDDSPSVIADDTLDGVAVVIGINPGQVTLNGTTVPSEVTLNADGTITVNAGSPSGTYEVTYEICENGANPANCKSNTATVLVENPLVANIDDFTGTALTIGDDSPSVIADDTLDGVAVVIGTNPGQVTLNGTTVPSEVTLNADGTITVNAGSPSGTYEVTYEICENGANPANCKSNTATVLVENPLVANIDDFTGTALTIGDDSPSVIADDTLDGVAVVIGTNPGQVTLNGTTVPSEVTLNADGTITVNAGSPSGTYEVTYEICENGANPANCKSNTATVLVENPLVANIDDFTGTALTIGDDSPSVIADDTLDGVAVVIGTNPGQVTLNGTTVPSEVTLNADGTITVNAGSPSGTYEVTYEICENGANPANCKSNTATVLVENPLVANIDDFTGTALTIGDDSPSVIADDTLDGVAVVIGTNPGQVTLNGTTVPSEVTLNADGTITVNAGSPSGTYEVTYEICENGANPANCKSNTATVLVENPLVANIDDFTGTALTIGDDSPSVIADDTLDGVAVVIGTNPGQVTLNGTTVPSEVTLNADGTITVNAGSPSGTYEVTYEICENGANPANCKSNTATVLVENPLVANIDDFTGTALTIGDDSPSVIADDTLDGVAVVIGINPGQVTLNGTTVPSEVTLNADGTITVNAGSPSGTYEVTYEICENGANPANCKSNTATVLVENPLVANIDDFTGTALTIGDDSPSVIADDTLDGVAVVIGTNPGQVILNGTTVPSEVTLNADGTITVNAGSPSGTYEVTYEICENGANPANCKSNTATVLVENPLVANIDDFTGTALTIGDDSPSVIADDTLDGVAVVIGTNPGQVTLNGTTVPSEVTLNADGTITVNAGSPSGTYEVTYEICENGANPANCKSNTATVLVENPLVANIDDFTGTALTIGDDSPSVIADDTLDGVAVVIGTNPGQVTLNGTTVPSEVTLNADGTITVNAGSPSGTYEVTYEICENGANPANCKSNTATVLVENPLVANIDDFTGTALTIGDDSPSVIADDTLDGVAVVIGINPGQVTLNGTTVPSEVTLNADGTITVNAGSPSGTYEVTYEICENGANPANCKSNTATVLVENPLVANIDDFTGTALTIGDDSPSVIADDSLDGVAVVIGTNPGQVTLNGTTVPSEVTLNADGTITVNAGSPSGTYEVTYEICENGANPANCKSNTATVLVENVLEAINYIGTPITSGGTTSSITDNDILNTTPIIVGSGVGEITLSADPNGTNPSGFILNPNGTITVETNIPSGAYDFEYQICENGANPENCQIAVATIIVANPIDAINDDYSNNPLAAGSVTPSILINDLLDGNSVIIGTGVGEVTLLGNPNGTNPLGFTFNSDGTIAISTDIASGTYVLEYQICENGSSPIKCNIGTVTILVGVDTDGDGILNTDDIDDDNDGILDTNEGDGTIDTDNDGIPDSLDTDSDNDGLLDIIEGNDNDGNGIPDLIPSGVDTDLDGLDDVFDTDNGGVPTNPSDTDGDGIFDYQDIDDDNDGINTIDENPGDNDITTNDSMDTNENGIPDYLDEDVNPCGTPYNIMTPDNDGENDSFFISCIDKPEYANNTVEIFNRWGNTVYKASGYNNESVSFKGISNGRTTLVVDEKLPPGTYYYVIDLGDGSKPKVGWLYINR